MRICVFSVIGDRLVDDKDRTHLMILMTLIYETAKGSLRVKEEMGFSLVTIHCFGLIPVSEAFLSDLEVR
jgi:hypothetical protein